MKTFKDIQTISETFEWESFRNNNQNIDSSKFSIGQIVSFGEFSGSVKRELKKQYGSTRHFCRVHQFNYFTITNGLNLRLSADATMDVYRCIAKILETEFNPECYECITEHQRESIRVAIATKFRTIKSFVHSNPQFTYSFVHNVISGKRKFADSRFNELFNESVK